MRNSTIELIYFSLIQLFILLIVVVYYQVHELWQEKQKHRVKLESPVPSLIEIDELSTVVNN